MARKIADGSNEDTEEKPATPVKRLCNEIQLFDLCELEKCGHKQGQFCTSPELLNRFEAIAEEEARPAPGFVSDDADDMDASDYDGYDDSYDDDRFGDDDYEEDE